MSNQYQSCVLEPLDYIDVKIKKSDCRISRFCSEVNGPKSYRRIVDDAIKTLPSHDACSNYVVKSVSFVSKEKNKDGHMLLRLDDIPSSSVDAIIVRLVGEKKKKHEVGQQSLDMSGVYSP